MVEVREPVIAGWTGRDEAVDSRETTKDAIGLAQCLAERPEAIRIPIGILAATDMKTPH